MLHMYDTEHNTLANTQSDKVAPKSIDRTLQLNVSSLHFCLACC